MKILLPFLALVILSTLFLLSRTIEPSQKLPYADVDAREFAREQRIGAPNYSGVAANGAAITVVADSARPQPNNPQVINAHHLNARISQSDGTILDFAALGGMFDSDSKNAVLMGGVTVTSSKGYTLNTEQMRAKFDGSAMDADDDVVVVGPELRIEAGSLQVRLKPGNEGGRGYVLDFNGGLKLVYTPKE